MPGLEPPHTIQFIEKGWAEDGRAIASQLERERVIPSPLEPRIRAMTNELVLGVTEALEEPGYVELARSLAAPMRRLTTLMSDRERGISRPSDRDEVLLSFIEVADVIDNFEAGPAIWADADPLTLLEWLREELPITQHELASWIGTSVRSLQRWTGEDSSPSGEDEAQIRALARLVTELRYLANGRARVQWLTHENPIAAGQSPIAVLSDEWFVAELARYLRSARAL